MAGAQGEICITVVGAGGIGCALLPLLAATGPTEIRVVDGDTIEIGNLPRQPLYGPADLGALKTSIAVQRIRSLAPHTTLKPIPHFLDPGNIRALLEGSTVVADCTDDLHARLLLDRTCGELRIPLVSGAVHRQQVQVLSLHTPDRYGHSGRSLRDWFPNGIGAGQDGCDMRVVPAPVTTVAAACMAMRISALLAGDPSSVHLLDLIDLRHGSWMRIHSPGPAMQDELIAQTGSRGQGGEEARNHPTTTQHPLA